MTLTFMLGKGGNAFGIQIHSLISLNIHSFISVNITGILLVLCIILLALKSVFCKCIYNTELGIFKESMTQIFSV